MGATDRARNLCVLVLPTEREALHWAPKNRMSVEQLWNSVFFQYEFATLAFADPRTDVVAIHSPDACHLPSMLARLRGFRTVCVQAAPRATKLFVWCHTPVVQTCPVSVRVHLEDVMACPRVTLLQNDVPAHKR